MNPITKLFDLLDNYIEIDEFAKHATAGGAWWSKIRTDDDAMNKTEVFQKQWAAKDGSEGTRVWPWVRKVKVFCDEWYGALAVCVAYFIGMAVMDDVTSPVQKDDEKQDNTTIQRRKV